VPAPATIFPETELVPELVRLDVPFKLTTVPDPEPKMPPLERRYAPELPETEVILSTVPPD
jgi:hypothetical protein